MPRIQTPREEQWNVYTHAFGIAVFIIGTIWLIYKASVIQFPYIWAAVIVYAMSQLFLYAASTSYHAAIGNWKIQLRKVDHIAIYISIAGTYTPMCLLMLEKTNGWLILIAVWGIALFGLLWKLFFTGKFEAFSSVLYLVMGWMIVLDITNVRLLFTDIMINWLIAGGIFFSVGIVFYSWSKLYFNHVIWHLFVLGGSISHLFMVVEVLKSVS